MYKNILLAYDGSQEGALALREGALLAKTCCSKIVLLCVVPDGTVSVQMAEGVSGTPVDQTATYGDVLNQAVAWLTQRGFEPTPKLVVGSPAHCIGAVAKEMTADLVVVGHGHKNFLSRWWSGSTRAYLSDHVGCSILIASNAIGEEAFGTA